MSGVAVSDECVEKYNQIKMKKDLRYVIFKIQDRKVIVPADEGPTTETFDDWKQKLSEKDPCYSLVDIEYESDDGRKQAKLCFVFWSPDGQTSVKDRMVYASSKDAIKKKFPGIMKEIQANDMGDLDWSTVHKTMKG
mmetsp:Transcript_95402/g.307902  ORF Transcript_95402/g.307902 Transcript_95402/m.307902 type:complete len:137 (-) Transcript_95402:43-453(-)